jgi:hypothetical protein
MITPVENGSTWRGSTCSRPASAAQVARALQAVLAGAGVGIAGVDDHGADGRAARQMLAADLHRRGAEAVLREHAGHAGAFVQQQHGQVLAVGLAHAGLGHAQSHAGDREELRGIGAVRLTGMVSGKEEKSVQGAVAVLVLLAAAAGRGSLRPTRGTAAAVAAIEAAMLRAAASGTLSASPVSVGAV